MQARPDADLAAFEHLRETTGRDQSEIVRDAVHDYLARHATETCELGRGRAVSAAVSDRTYPGRVLETARRPRHLALLAVATVCAAVFVALGFWQYGVAAQDGREQALREGPRQPVIALDQLVRPHQPFPAKGSLRRVATTGTYDAQRTFFVADRRLDGQRGYWVVTPLVTDSSSARLPVLRGFVTDPSDASPPPSGPIRLTGSLAPAEAPQNLGPLPAGQHWSVDVPTLLNEWGGQVYNAFVFVVDQQPAETGPALQPVPTPPPDVGGMDWRNFGYALQWWVFAAFAFYLWWRSVREDFLDEQVIAERAIDVPGPADAGREGTHV